MDEKEIQRIYHSCTRFLAGHGRTAVAPQQTLAELSALAGSDARPDHYGQGDLILDFEAEVAALLGKEAAVFMPSGTMCQQIALRIWADRRATHHVAFHPTCHLEIHEEKGYQLLHNLHGILVGSPDRLMALDDLQRVAERPAALLIELPQREIGGQLPAWDDLAAMLNWARERGIVTHMDGARLWECGPFYRRAYAEIAALFDSVYVSFYKGLGGLAGAMLAGPSDVIAEARVWQRRHGGNLIRLFPYVLSAKHGLAARLPRMEAYHRKAVEIAGALSALPHVEIVPNPPQTNMMHLYLRGDKDRLERAALDLARETGTWTFTQLRPGSIHAYHKLELSVGDATLELTTNEIVDLFRALLERAQ
jgi:threonine aldolase